MLNWKKIAAAGVLIMAASGGALAADRTIVILQSLTGVGGFVGAPATEGMKYAADEINATGFLGADKLKVIVADDASDKGQATAAVTRYAQDPSILAILGPTISSSDIPAAAVANDVKIPLFTMTLATDVLKAGPWSFISAAQTPDITMPILGDYALNTMKVKSCALVSLSDNQAYVDLAATFRAYVEPKGMKFTDFTGVKSADSDFSAISTRIVAENPECVLLFTTAPVAANLVIQLKQAGLDPKTKFLGQTALSSPAPVQIGGAAVEGVVFNADWAPGGSSAMGKAFAAGFKKAKNVDADNWNALGYSYMYVLATAIKNAGANPTRASILDALTHTKDVPIAAGNGTYTLDANRIPHYGVAFLTVKNGAFVPVQ
jgi:branched-chain amino acid transport system substrate-binding protein